MSGATASPRVLAIDPISRGFGFAVLEGPTTLVDWGIRNTTAGDSDALLRKVRTLLAQYRADVIVVEDCHVRSSRRRQRVRTVIEGVRGLATRDTEVVLIPFAVVRRTFGASANKHGMATAVAAHFPELRFHLPPERRAWMSEDTRMAIFDATALALTVYLLDDEVTSHQDGGASNGAHNMPAARTAHR